MGEGLPVYNVIWSYSGSVQSRAVLRDRETNWPYLNSMTETIKFDTTHDILHPVLCMPLHGILSKKAIHINLSNSSTTNTHTHSRDTITDVMIRN